MLSAANASVDGSAGCMPNGSEAHDGAATTSRSRGRRTASRRDTRGGSCHGARRDDDGSACGSRACRIGSSRASSPVGSSKRGAIRGAERARICTGRNSTRPARVDRHECVTSTRFAQPRGRAQGSIVMRIAAGRLFAMFSFDVGYEIDLGRLRPGATAATAGAERRTQEHARPRPLSLAGRVARRRRARRSRSPSEPSPPTSRSARTSSGR